MVEEVHWGTTGVSMPSGGRGGEREQTGRGDLSTPYTLHPCEYSSQSVSDSAAQACLGRCARADSPLQASSQNPSAAITVVRRSGSKVLVPAKVRTSRFLLGTPPTEVQHVVVGTGAQHKMDHGGPPAVNTEQLWPLSGRSRCHFVEEGQSIEHTARQEGDDAII